MNTMKPAPPAARRVVDPKEQAAADAVLGALARDAQALTLFDRATDLALEDPTAAATTAQHALLMECAVRLQQHADVRALLDLTGTLNRLRRVRDILIDPDAPSGRNAGQARLRPGTELVPGQRTRFFEEDGIGLLVSWQGTPAERNTLQPYTDWWGQQLGGAENTRGRPAGKTSATEPRGVFLANVQRALEKVWRDRRRVPTVGQVAKVYGQSRSRFYDLLTIQRVDWTRVRAWRPASGVPLEAHLDTPDPPHA